MSDSTGRPPSRSSDASRPGRGPGRRSRDGQAGRRPHSERATAQPQPQHPPRAIRALRPMPGDISEADVETLLAEAESGAPPDLTDVRVVRRTLRRHGLRPNASFAQHLLVDRDALEAAVAAAEIGPAESVLELGAGMGVLTVALAPRAGRVVAVELEREILPILRETTERFANVEIIQQNLLDIQPEDLFGQEPYKLVANLPYYITAAALRHFLEAAHRPMRLVVMVQREVAERLVAAPGDLSLLALSVQFYGRPSIVRVVPAASFYPPPKVDSAIVRVDVHAEPPLDPATRALLFGIARAGFAERRKQLHNTLARNLKAPRSTIETWLAAADIDPVRRAETLSIAEWIRLTRAAQEHPWGDASFAPERRDQV